MTKIKICGIKNQDGLDACNGADFVGFVFYDKSPRYISPDDARKFKTNIKRVGLFVNPSDKEIDASLSSIDIIQLHGSETQERTHEIKQKFGVPIIKALNIQKDEICDYEAADWMMVDSCAGGSGKTFDWRQKVHLQKPWFLAGGVNIDNVEKAIKLANPYAIDISSGVEITRGVKDAALIRAFIKKVKSL